VGAVSLEDRRQDWFDDQQEELLTTLCSHAAAILHHARLHRDTDRSLEEATRRLVLTEKAAALGRFASGVAHQLNNALSVITTSMTNLRRHPDRLERYLDRIDVAARDAAMVIKNLRALAANRPLETAPLDLNELVDSALTAARGTTPVPEVAVQTTFDQHLPAIPGNRNSLSQVLHNLIDNAFLALPEGGSIRLRTCYEPEGPWAMVQIEDDGAGIPPQEKARIFDPFYTTRPEGGGMGLGLSICHQIIEQHRGEIDVKSRPGETVFTVRLPVVPGETRG
jgi:signal transduction histidine kinase